MSDVVALAEQARRGLGEGRSVASLVEELGAAPRWKVDAAYAYVRRRDSDPEFTVVADLFEVTIACRKPKVLSGPRWWHYYETLLAGLGLMVAAYIALPLLPPSDAELGWWFVIRALVYVAVPVAAFRLGHNLPSRTGERAAYLTGETTRIVELLDDILVETSDLDVAAERVRRAALSRRDEVSQWLASFVLASAHYRLAAMPRSKRRRKMEVVDRARRAQIQEAGLPPRTGTWKAG